MCHVLIWHHLPPRQLVYSFPVLFWVVNIFTQKEKEREQRFAAKEWGREME